MPGSLYDYMQQQYPPFLTRRPEIEQVRPTNFSLFWARAKTYVLVLLFVVLVPEEAFSLLLVRDERHLSPRPATGKGVNFRQTWAVSHAVGFELYLLRSHK